MSHEAAFLHDESCPICEAHRRSVSAVRFKMLTDLKAAAGEELIARPWSPAEEWDLLLQRLASRSRGGA